MKIIINDRLAALRKVMKIEHLSAFIFTCSDPHNNEYLPAHWKGLEWISGFNGTAGTAVVTMNGAALWTDSRYFIAAEEQLVGTGFELMKEKMPGTPTVAHWLGLQLAYTERAEVGIDGFANHVNYVESLIAALRHEGGITVRCNFDPLAKIWVDRPALPSNSVFIRPMEFSGEACHVKIQRIRESLKKNNACGMLVSALDDIAWMLNLRGSDVECNPVFVSYLLLDSKRTTLFIDKKKLSDAVAGYLKQEGVSVDGYDNIEKALKSYREYNILLDPSETSYYLYNKVDVVEIIRRRSIVSEMKAVKNETEMEGFHRAMISDGIAMVKFLYWLQTAVRHGEQTEMSIDKVLTGFRAEQNLFHGLSFGTIAAYQEHGAIVHYEANEETDKALEPEGLLLLDSGAQYDNGTTDITRTIALGAVTDEQKHIYTLVLKGHIQFAMCKFPSGASGTQLDILARKDMWREGINYLHATGHGVGSFLCVHEGPQQARMNYVDAPLLRNMTITDEPGIYLAGKFGVRIENTLVTKHYMNTETGEFLEFEPLTLCPIDTTPIDVDMMTSEELEWLNDYHLMVRTKLSPFLDNDKRIWLEMATAPICK